MPDVETEYCTLCGRLDEEHSFEELLACLYGKKEGDRIFQASLKKLDEQVANAGGEWIGELPDA